MRVKHVKIGLKSAKAFLREAEETMVLVAAGKSVKRQSGVYFESLAAVRHALTDNRLAVLHAIKTDRPCSVYALAKLLDRDIKNVTEDIHYLEELGLVDLRTQRRGRKRTVPAVDYELIRLDIAV